MSALPGAANMSSADSPAPENKPGMALLVPRTDDYKALPYSCVSLLPRPRSKKSRRGLGVESLVSPYPPVNFQ